MRIRVDIPDEQAQALARIAKREGVSVEDLIREAIADFVEKHRFKSRPGLVT